MEEDTPLTVRLCIGYNKTWNSSLEKNLLAKQWISFSNQLVGDSEQKKLHYFNGQTRLFFSKTAARITDIGLYY